jgi:predicted transcriptional regulator
VLTKLLQDKELLNSPVTDVMDESFPVLEVDTNLSEIKKQLQRSPAVLIEDFKRITGIITRSDVLELQK